MPSTGVTAARRCYSALARNSRLDSTADDRFVVPTGAEPVWVGDTSVVRHVGAAFRS